MDYARDVVSGKIVSAEDASRSRRYVCPRPGCGGRVYLPLVIIQRRHFRHSPGQGAPECDLYFPPMGYSGEHLVLPAVEVEDQPDELGMLIEEVDDGWSLLLRLPEIPATELGDESLAALQAGFVEIAVAGTQVSRVNAIELRPGLGSARVAVSPSLDPYRVTVLGEWPPGVDQDRWRAEAAGLSSIGTAFRMRGGEWVRLRKGSGVHAGETLLVLSEAPFSPPPALVVETLRRFPPAAAGWTLWQVQLPEGGDTEAMEWLGALGHQLVPRPWTLRLSTPPIAYSADWQPVFWGQDPAVLELEAPDVGSQAVVTVSFETNTHSAEVTTDSLRRAYILFSSRRQGVAEFSVAGERSASTALLFEDKFERLRDALGRIPILRLTIGDERFQAWNQSKNKGVRVRPATEVRVDPGLEGVRVQLSVWLRGKRRIFSSLAPQDAEAKISEVLATASRIVVDADNVGRIEVMLNRPQSEMPRDAIGGRVTQWERLLARAHHGKAAPTTRTHIPAHALIRARLAARRRQASGGAQ